MTKLPMHALIQAFTIRFGSWPASIVARAFTGNDLVLHFTVVDADGDPVSIAAWTTRAAALYTQASPAVLSKTPAFVTDGTNGEFTVTITDTDTSAFAADVYRLEVQMTGTGIKTTVVRGSVVLRKTYA